MGRDSAKGFEADPLEGGDAEKEYRRSVTRHEEEPTGKEAHRLCRSERWPAPLPSRAHASDTIGQREMTAGLFTQA